MRGTRCAADGWSEYWTVATTCAPAPATNNISVAPGARLTIRSGGLSTVTGWPVSSETVMCEALSDTAAAKSAPGASAVVSIEATIVTDAFGHAGISAPRARQWFQLPSARWVPTEGRRATGPHRG